MKISFGGHIDLGEIVTEEHKETVKLASKEESDTKGILIGDIGIPEKILSYFYEGIEGVRKTYEKRIDCSVSECIIQQLPGRDGIEDVIDLEQYDIAKELLEKKEDITKILSKYSTFEEVVKDKDYSKVRSFINKKVSGKLTEYVLEKYGARDFKVYSERKIRNRIKEKKRFWKKLAEFKEYLDSLSLHGEIVIDKEKGRPIPTCRGIYLAFLEDVGKKYDEASFHYQKKHKRSVSKGTELYEKVKKSIFEYVRPKKWSLKVKNEYR